MNKGGVQEDHVVPNIIAGIYFHDCPSAHTCELDQFFTRICECKCVLILRVYVCNTTLSCFLDSSFALYVRF